MSKSKIILEGLQIKSIEKAQRLAYALNIIEEECGIKETEIVIKDCFLCPWINLKELSENDMELLLKGLLED